jgi:hypothetical protein
MVAADVASLMHPPMFHAPEPSGAGRRKKALSHPRLRAFWVSAGVGRHLYGPGSLERRLETTMDIECGIICRLKVPPKVPPETRAVPAWRPPTRGFGWWPEGGGRFTSRGRSDPDTEPYLTRRKNPPFNPKSKMASPHLSRFLCAVGLDRCPAEGAGLLTPPRGWP